MGHDNVTWFKLKSWHAYRYTSRGSRYIARCGKWTNGGDVLNNTLPLDERSCESCLRLLQHDAEKE